MPLSKMGDYRDQGFLYPLNKFLGDFEKKHGRPYHGINALYQMWNVCYDGGTIDCVPFNEYYQTVYCRREIFARAGLPFEGPKNWDDLYFLARRMHREPAKEPDGDPSQPKTIGMRVLAAQHAGWNFMPYVWNSGGQIVQSYFRRGEELIPVPAPPVDFRQLNIGVANPEVHEQERLEAQSYLRERGLPDQYSIEDLEWRLVTDSPEAMAAFRFQRRLVHQPWIRNGDHEFDVTREMIIAQTAVDPATGEEFDLTDPKVKDRVYHGVTNAMQWHSGEVYERTKYAMWMGTIQEAEAWEPKLFFAVPFPRRPGYPPASYVGGNVLGINAAIRPSDQPLRGDVEAIRKAAWKYIEFVTGPEAQQLKMKTFLEFGLEENVKPALLTEGGYEDLVDRIPQQRRYMWDHHEAYARAQPHIRGFNEITGRALGIPFAAMIVDQPDEMTGRFKRDLKVLMDETCFRVNNLILGKMPDDELARRSRVGWVIFAVMAAGMALGGYGVVRLAMRMQSKARDLEGFGVGGHPARRRAIAWVLLMPAVGTVLIWNYFPLVKGLAMAFQDYRIVGESSYVGLRNFVEAVSAPKFWRYLLQTAQYMTFLVGIGFCVPIALALLLHEVPRGKVAYRVIYYLPAVTTGMVTLFLWKTLLYEPSDGGALNSLFLAFNDIPVGAAAALKIALNSGLLVIVMGLLGQASRVTNSPAGRVSSAVAAAALAYLVVLTIGGPIVEGGPAGLVAAIWSPFDFSAQKFLADADLAMFWCVIPPIWAAAGPGCLIYLAALKGIPEEQYEAADIDGAGLWHKMWNVTYPNLKALIIINFVGAVIAGFKESSNIFVMTGGGPEDATMTIGLEIWYNAFLYLNFGRATAMAWIMGALLIGFTLNQLRILNKLQFRSAAVEEEVRGAR
jgi:multiple sugar transport system permease protein